MALTRLVLEMCIGRKIAAVTGPLTLSIFKARPSAHNMNGRWLSLYYQICLEISWSCVYLLLIKVQWISVFFYCCYRTYCKGLVSCKLVTCDCWERNNRRPNFIVLKWMLYLNQLITTYTLRQNLTKCGLTHAGLVPTWSGPGCSKKPGSMFISTWYTLCRLFCHTR